MEITEKKDARQGNERCIHEDLWRYFIVNDCDVDNVDLISLGEMTDWDSYFPPFSLFSVFFEPLSENEIKSQLRKSFCRVNSIMAQIR